MRTEEIDFQLPAELIAQSPTAVRAASRLMHYRIDDQSIAHRTFSDLPSLLRAGDILVFNDAKVIPARFMLHKRSGGKIEGLFLAEPRIGEWRVMLRNLGPLKPEVKLSFAQSPDIEVRVLEKHEDGEYVISVAGCEPAIGLLSRIGRMPLPPYIKREKDGDARDEFDRERYQTVFAKSPGSVAAPTAGLHFTEAVFAELEAKGVEKTFITLHVGMGTFKPVMSDTLEAHSMHSESYSIDEHAAAALNCAKREGRRIIPVGTTAARVLESQRDGEPFFARTSGTDIFIYPPYHWKHVSALITNFHLPRSTLIALVAARIGLDEQRRLYRVAIEECYRFFSYGDAMFLE